MAKAIEKESMSGSLLQNLGSLGIDSKGFDYSAFMKPDISSILLTKPSAFKFDSSQVSFYAYGLSSRGDH